MRTISMKSTCNVYYQLGYVSFSIGTVAQVIPPVPSGIEKGNTDDNGFRSSITNEAISTSADAAGCCAKFWYCQR